MPTCLVTLAVVGASMVAPQGVNAATTQLVSSGWRATLATVEKDLPGISEQALPLVARAIEQMGTGETTALTARLAGLSHSVLGEITRTLNSAVAGLRFANRRQAEVDALLGAPQRGDVAALEQALHGLVQRQVGLFDTALRQYGQCTQQLGECSLPGGPLPPTGPVTDPNLSGFLSQVVEPRLLPFVGDLLGGTGGAFSSLPPEIAVLELETDVASETEDLQRKVGLAALELFVDPTTARHLQTAAYNAAYSCQLYGCTQIEDEVLFLSYLPLPDLDRGVQEDIVSCLYSSFCNRWKLKTIATWVADVLKADKAKAKAVQQIVNRWQAQMCYTIAGWYRLKGGTVHCAVD